MGRFRGVGIGAGYFSKYQYEAWSRMPDVEIVALCNRKVDKGRAVMAEYGIPRHYTDYREMIEREKPDFVDIITPPDTHLEMCSFAAGRGVHARIRPDLVPKRLLPDTTRTETGQCASGAGAGRPEKST